MMRRLLPAFLLCLAACGRGAAPPRAPTAPKIVLAATSVSATPPQPNTLSTEVYVGAVGGLPVRATLTLTPSHIEGQWVYEGRGSADGLTLEGVSAGRNGYYEVLEVTAAGEVTGKMSLHHGDPILEGEWEQTNGDPSLPVVLTREVRAREGENVVRARRIMVKQLGPPSTTVPGFVPVIEGPAAQRMMPSLEPILWVGDDEGETNLTRVDFEVLHHDARVVTISTNVETLGIYPNDGGTTVSLAWATGARIGANAIRADKKPELARLLDARVHASWRAAKRELPKEPTDDQPGCERFFDGDGPSFTEEMLDSLYVDGDGISFFFDFEFPYYSLACSPHVDMSVRWAEARPYLDPAGVLGDR